MKHKLLFLFVSLLLPLAASAYDACINGIYYNIVKKAKQATVTYGDSEGGTYSGNVVIPATVEYDGVTCNVVAIGESAFRLCKELTSVIIPENVITIADKAFEYCVITKLSIPSTLSSIGEYAFSDSRITELYISDIASFCNLSVDWFDYRYADCILSHSNHLFMNGVEVTELVVPDGVTKINNGVFAGAKMLTSVTIPGSVTEIGEKAFYQCENLKVVSISNSNLTMIGGAAFLNCNLNSFSITDLAAWCKTHISINTIYGTAIEGTNPMQIAEKVYLNNRELTDLEIPTSVDTIHTCAFIGAKTLKTVTIPATVKELGSYAFSGCTGLECATIGDGVTTINDYAFAGCTSLKNMTVGRGVKEVYWGAVDDCTNLENVYVSDLAAWCQINFDGDYYNDSHSWIETRPQIAYCNPLTYAKHFFVNGVEIKNLVIPEEVTEIGSRAFRLFSGLTSVTIHDKVKKIGSGAFAGCDNLKSAIVGNGIEILNQFNNCGNLETLAMGTNVEEVELSGCKELTDVYCTAADVPKATFSEDCQVGYATLHVLGEFIEQYRAADGWKNFGTIVAMKEGDPGYFKPDMTPIAFADATVKAICVENWDYNGDGQLSIFEASQVKDLGNKFSGKDITSFNELKYFTAIKTVNFQNCSTLTSIIIPSGVTSIGEYAFEGCKSLTSITIPNSVTSIETRTFRNCTSLTSVIIPNSVTSIGFGAFEGCSSLTSANIPNSVTSIKAWAFGGCSSLTTVTIPNNVTSIGVKAFYDCSSLTAINIGSLEAWCGIEFGSTPFEYSYSLYLNGEEVKDLVIPSKITTIGANTFYKCGSLTSVTIPPSVTSIGKYAFNGCNNLKAVHISDLKAWCKIEFAYELGYFRNNPLHYAHHLYLNKKEITNLVIPSSITTIKSQAFEGCSSLTSITIPNTVTSIENYAFLDCTGLAEVCSMIEEPFAIEEQVFGYDVPIRFLDSATLYVPRGTKSKYQSTDGWKNFTTIIETDFSDEPKGDVNGDQTVDVADMATVIDMMATGTNDASADVNGDGVVDVADIATIISEMAANARRLKIDN